MNYRKQGPIRLFGQLKVIECQGSRGPFNVGELTTCLGEFKVIDQWLEQFNPGVFEGEFWIAALEPRSRQWKTRLFVEVQAKVVDFKINDADSDSSTSASEVPERDPILDDKPVVDQPVTNEHVPVATKPVTQASNEDVVVQRPQKSEPSRSVPASVTHSNGRADSQLRDLFGDELAELISTGSNEIKLDTTIDRPLFRKQCSHLKDVLKYELDFTRQVWVPPVLKV